MGLGPYPCHHHHCHHHCHYADSRSTGAAAGIILPLPSSVAILVAGLRLYCVCPLMGYLDLGPSVSGLGGKPLAIHVTHTKAITAVKPLLAVSAMLIVASGWPVGPHEFLERASKRCADGPRLMQPGLSEVNVAGSSTMCVCVWKGTGTVVTLR